MTDTFCTTIAYASLRLAAVLPRTRLSPAGRENRIPLDEYFCDMLFPELAKEFADQTNLNLDEVAAVALIVLLNRPAPGTPPASLRDELIAHVATFATALSAKARLRGIVQLALAFGCGWRRTRPTGTREWDEPWVAALQELPHLALPFVRKAYRVLAFKLEAFRSVDFSQQQSRELIASDAVLVAMRFALRRVDHDAPAFQRFQSLAFWDPTRGSLYGWLKVAIFGGRGDSIVPNYFRNGLLFEILCERSSDVNCDTLDIGKVAVQACPLHANKRIYRGGRCEKCGSDTVIWAEVHLVVPGEYLPRYFWRCPNSKPAHYFDCTLAKCPHDSQPRGERRTALLVRKEFTSSAEGQTEIAPDDTTD